MREIAAFAALDLSMERKLILFRIAVCDDDQTFRDALEEYISAYMKARSVECEIVCFSDGSLLLASDMNFNIVFLDIEMTNSNGIEVAEEIRRNDVKLPIVYVSSYTDYWRRAYKVHAYDFITKPVNRDRLISVLDDYMDNLSKPDEDTVTLRSLDGDVVLRTENIYYFEFEAKKKVCVHTTEGLVTVRGNLTDIFDMLDKEQFYQSRRDCVLNLRHVQKISEDYNIVMSNGDIIPLAHKKKNDFIEKLSGAFVKRMRECRS